MFCAQGLAKQGFCPRVGDVAKIKKLALNIVCRVGAPFKWLLLHILQVWKRSLQQELRMVGRFRCDRHPLPMWVWVVGFGCASPYLGVGGMLGGATGWEQK